MIYIKTFISINVLDAINEVTGGIVKDTGFASKTKAEIPDFSNISLLLTEDVDINQEIFTSLLENTGIKIDTAENGKIAVEKFEKNPDKYDIIIMDVHMPEMDGYEATKAIRFLEIEKAKSIPIIAMTANVFKDDIQRCIDSGMNDHLAKPIEVETVIEKILRYRTEWKMGADQKLCR